MSAAHILVVEDDPKTAETVRLYLTHAGFEVTLAWNGTQALEEAARVRPDLVVLDLMLPRLGGREVFRRLRAAGDVPVVMLTARASEDDTLEGLALGADDYVTKPFSPRELVARIETVLRRARRVPEDRALPLSSGDLTLDPVAHRATRAGAALALTPREFALLEIFLRAPGRAFSREELLALAFGEDTEAMDRTVDVHVKNLRQKIEDDPARPRRIATVFGVGYRFEGASE